MVGDGLAKYGNNFDGFRNKTIIFYHVASVNKQKKLKSIKISVGNVEMNAHLNKRPGNK